MAETQQYWTVSVDGAAKVGGSAFVVASLKGNVFLSATTKLCSDTKCCKLDSPDLAESFAKELEPIIRKRQKADVTLRVMPVQMMGPASQITKLREQISVESSEVRTRLRTQNFAPNKAV